MYYKTYHSQLYYMFQYGETALHIAACNGQLEILRLLINNGCDLHITDKVNYV